MKSVIRNFISKMIAGRSDDGIMITLSDPRKVDFQAAMMEDLLMRNGIDPRAITNETQLKNIINQIKAAEAQRIRNIDVSGIRTIEPGKVFDMEGKQIPRGSDIMSGKAVPGTSDRERVRNEMKTKYGFTDKRLDEIENTPVDEKMADDLLREDDERIIKERLEKQNKDSVQRFKDKMDDPEKKANGGRIGFKGGADMSTVADSKGNVGAKSVNVSPSGSVTTSRTKGPDGPDDRGNADQNFTQYLVNQGYTPKEINRITKGPNLLQKTFNKYNSLPFYAKGAINTMAPVELMKLFNIGNALNTGYDKITNPYYEEEDLTLGGIGGINTSMLKDSPYENMNPQFMANGGRIGYKIGAGKKGVQGLLDLVRKKFGKKSIKVLENEPDFSLNILNDFNIPRPESAVIRDKMKNFGKPGKFNKDGSIDYDYYAEILNDSENTFVYGDETIEELEKMAKARLDEIAEYKAMYDRGELDKYAPSKLDNVNDEQIAAAVDDIFPTGDPKYDAEMASEALVENNPQIFGDGVLLDDLDDSTRSKIYGAVYDVLSNNMVKMRELKKATKPEKTLKSMKEGKGINMSDPEIAEEFTRFMKETDPEGYKKLEQTVELSNFDPKGRKKNATGGRAGFFMGSKPVKGLATLRQMLNYFGKKSDRVKNPSDILKIVNPKQFNKVLEDPNIYRKFDTEKGIAAPDLIKNVQKQMMMDRQKTIQEMLGAAKNIKKLDDDTLKYKNNMIEDMMKKGVDRKMAEEMAETISDMAKGAAGKFNDTPKLTDEGVLQLENILKDMETGGKKPRELNATGGRIGYKDGPGMNRRTFLKLLGGLASIPIIGKIVKPLKTVKGVKNVPVIKTDNVPGKPEWFDQLVNKVIIEGDDVTKKLATKDREVIHTKKLNDTDEVTVYQDLETDSIRVEYNSPQNMLEEPVDLMYKKTLPDEGAPKGSIDFEVTESGFAGRRDGPDDFYIDAEEVGGSSIKDLDSDVSKLKEYATGKKPTMKEFIQNKKRKDKVKKLNEGDLEAQSDYIVNRQGDYVDYDDYASGGIAKMLGE